MHWNKKESILNQVDSLSTYIYIKRIFIQIKNIDSEITRAAIV